jgi:minor extracellular serine protease Vpr
MSVAALVGLVVVVLTTAASAQVAASGGRFERLPGAVNYTGFKPGSLGSKATVTAIVQMQGDPVAKVEAQRGRKLTKAEKDSIRNDLEAKQQDVKSRAQCAGGTVLFDYQDAYNGVAVRVPASALPSLASAPGVASIHISRSVERENIPGVQYIRGNEAWTAGTGFTGTGQKIAILDTGVDYTHANFGGPGTPQAFTSNNGTIIEPGTFPTSKVVGGTDFVGDAYDASSDDAARTIPHPDPDPLDCNGHGSHVAGTAAGFGVLANGTTYPGPYNGTTYLNSFRIGPGVAPNASILAYRVFGCEGSASDDVIVAGINQAVADGATVISMSLGSVFGRADAPDSVAADNASLDGVVVVAAAGNAGPSAYITDGPGASDRTISAAAVDSSGPEFPGVTVALSTGQTIVAQNSNEATLPSGALPVAVLRTSYPSGPVSLGCDPAEYANYPGGVAGKLVVTLRGTCARVARAIFGQKAGAAAVAMINTDAGYPPFEGPITSNPDTGEKFTVTIPFLGVRGVLGPAATADGDNLVAADGGSATLAPTTVPNPGFQHLAGFSSGGPRNVDSVLKPDVAAPGVSVLSTAIGTGNQGTRISGTSMATPMTSGSAALVRQAHPAWTSERVKAALMDTANNTDKLLGYNVRTAGSGVVDARRAVDTVGLITTQAGRGNLSFGAEALTAAYSETLPLTIQNTSGSPLTYNLTSAFNGSALGATMTLPSVPVTVPAGGSQTVNATLALSAAAVAGLPGAEASNFGALTTIKGIITATPTVSGASIYPLHIPFLVAPRGLSNVTASTPNFGPQPGGPLFSANVQLANAGIHAGSAEVYAWGIHDANDVAHPEDSMDVRDVGVESLDAGGGDRLLVFAVNNYGRWSNPATSEIDVAIDTNGDNNADFFVVGVDFGAVTTGTFDGRFASLTIDTAGNIVSAFIAEAPMNTSTALLPALASDMGLTSAHSSFRYAVASFSIVPGGLVDTTSTAEFDAFDPPVSNGDLVESIGPGGSAPLTLSYDRSKVARAKTLGWLLVTPDDATGAAEADEIPFK